MFLFSALSFDSCQAMDFLGGLVDDIFHYSEHHSGFNTEQYKKSYPCHGDAWQNWLHQPSGVAPRPKKKKEEIVVSVTSHPPRIGTTWLAIESLMRQNKKPHRIVLNLAEEDFPDRKIPQTLEILKKRGLEVHFSPINYKVATKLIPSLKAFPKAAIVTADDDRVYDPNWLHILLDQHAKHPDKIICPHVRRYVYKTPNSNSSSSDHPQPTGSNYPSHDVVYDTSSDMYPRIDYMNQQVVYDTPIFGIFEGFAGVLYPRKALHPEVFNVSNFKQLTPCADDVWFQVMALLNGTKTISPPEDLAKSVAWAPEIDDTQATGLFHEHLSANGTMAYRALYYYGLLDKIGIPYLKELTCHGCRRDVPLVKQGESFPPAPVVKGKKCKACLNDARKKVLAVGAYDYGNIGDRIYKEVFTHTLGGVFDLYTVPDTLRMNASGQYVGMSRPDEDIDFDALIIGGGGILKDFPESGSSINYYMKKAVARNKPFFLVSVGLQTSRQELTASQAEELMGSSADLMRKASLIFPRSLQDYTLLSQVLGESVRDRIYLKPDLGYIYPSLIQQDRSKRKKYITLIQTGSASVEMDRVRDIIHQKLHEFPSSKLVVMNWGGLEKPGMQKDFKEWDLFATKTREYFPNAIVYMGDTLSDKLKQVRYAKTPIRSSDLTPQTATDIVARSHHVVTGRYHGQIIAKALGIPFTVPIFTYKCNAEKQLDLNPTTAIDTIDYLKSYIDNTSVSIPYPSLWNDEQRNNMIVITHVKYPHFSIKYIQAMDNNTLYQMNALWKS
ncbi:MAG: polysaccharide pyruvyl transferase family protein [Alphaproteobacteria bacterium]|nr:polysaccharide pyruvyl transferase family protein [Alphaproteobacteria bacterium]